jgi:hypothetical protein
VGSKVELGSSPFIVGEIEFVRLLFSRVYACQYEVRLLKEQTFGWDRKEIGGSQHPEREAEALDSVCNQTLPHIFDGDSSVHLTTSQILGRLDNPSRRRLLRSLATMAAASPLRRTMLTRAAALPGPPTFEEVPASKSGIHWVHNAGKSAEKYLPESSGAGCAFLDYDNDGWMDIYLVNSGKANFYNPPQPLRNALYRNNRDGTFTDVTLKAGVAGGGYGMGVAVGDYNGDGYPDIYVTQVGRNILYRNNGDGTFTDVTEKAGVAARPAGAPARSGSTMTTTASSTCSSASSPSSTWRTSAAWMSAGVRHYCIPKIFNPDAELALSQQRRRHIYRCEQIDRDRRAFGEGLGSRSHRCE